MQSEQIITSFLTTSQYVINTLKTIAISGCGKKFNNTPGMLIKLMNYSWSIKCTYFSCYHYLAYTLYQNKDVNVYVQTNVM